MGCVKTVREACIAAMLGALAVGAVSGCAAPSRSVDWREAVKAGDHRLAYSELFRTWRDGTADVKAAALRDAWRSPDIMAVARPDLTQTLRQAAGSHAGDLAAFERSIENGPLAERLAFAKLLDRTIDVDREVAVAFAQHSRVAQGGSVKAPLPATTPLAVEKASPPARVPTPSRDIVPFAPPAATARMPEPPAAATRPSSGPTPPEKPQPIAKAESAPKRLPHAALLAQVAQARSQAAWRCKGASACDKAWTAAETFAGRHSDMRIRAVTDTAIETYPPIVIGETGMTVAKLAVGGDEWEIRPTVLCRAGLLREPCPKAELRIYSAFAEFMRGAVGR